MDRIVELIEHARRAGPFGLAAQLDELTNAAARVTDPGELAEFLAGVIGHAVELAYEFGSAAEVATAVRAQIAPMYAGGVR